MNKQFKATFPLVSLVALEYLLGYDRKRLLEIASTVGRHYSSFRIIDPRNGKQRRIDNPHKILKKLQRRIKKRILDAFPLPEGVLGGVKGRSLAENLRIHSRKELVTCMDIRDCFPNVSHETVLRIFKRKFGCSKQIASLLTKLTTLRGRLPQGTPTSTTLATLALLPMYLDLESSLTAKGLALSLWVDDITLSGPEHRHLLAPIIQKIQKHGFAIRNRKIKVLPRSACQWVTGGVVNKTPTIGKARRKEYRHSLMTADLTSTEECRKIASKLLFVKSINRRQFTALLKLWERRTAESREK